MSSVYTYGQPKIIGEDELDKYKEEVCSNVFVYVNDKDVVPRVPLKELGFELFPIKVAYDPKGKPITDKKAFKAFTDSVNEGVEFLVNAKEGICDHNIVAYIGNAEVLLR